MLKFVNKDVEGKNPFPSNKEYFEEFYEEGNNKGKTKQIWLNKDLTELMNFFHFVKNEKS